MMITTLRFDCCEINHDLWGHELLKTMNLVAVNLEMTCVPFNGQYQFKL